MSTGPSQSSSPGPLAPFSVECSQARGGSLIATITGDIDIATAETLVSAVTAGVAANPTTGVVLDFAAVGFMDSTGLRALLEIDRALEDGTGLVLLSPANAVRKLLTLAGLDDRIPVATTLDQAQIILEGPVNGA
jgi:anti-sigma B factor antagonist